MSVMRQQVFRMALGVCLVWAAASYASEARKISTTVAMRDGTRLATDIYLPAGKGPFPTLLVRTPYDMSKPQLGRGAEGATKRGYALVLQDCRGRYASEGENLPFIGEVFAGHEDGVDTIRWIAAQPWCNGKVGMYGGSATGMTQLWAAARGPENLTALHIGVAPTSFYHHMVTPGGIFRNHLMRSWLGVNRFEPRALQDWTEHEAYDEYWKVRDVGLDYSKVNVPAVHIGGYYDIFVEGTIASYNGYQFHGGPGARGKQKLLLGPWMHKTLIEYSGTIRFPGADKPTNNIHDKWRWFDHYLKGVDNGIDREAPVTYYVMGDVDDPSAPGNRWRTDRAWPPAASEEAEYFLHADTLTYAKPDEAGAVTYRFDPSDPAPTVGGMQLFGDITVGTQDQQPLEARPDVRSFSSPALPRPFAIAGQPRVDLWVSTDARDTDFHVKLCDVYPDGRSINVCEGQLRARFRESFREPKWMEPGKVYRLTIPLSNTAVAFNKGHRVC